MYMQEGPVEIHIPMHCNLMGCNTTAPPPLTVLSPNKFVRHLRRFALSFLQGKTRRVFQNVIIYLSILFKIA